MTALVTGDADAPAEQAPAFAVRLDNFEGPFDLLLSLISKHKLDITEVALSRVTDEFIAHVKAAGPEWDLEQTSSFLLVAATLLDLKAARLLPQGDVEDEEDLALLEARDLLFARLLQYRAFKQVAAVLEGRLAGESRRHPRAVGLEERFANLLPEVLIGIGLEQFADLAARAMEPKPVLEVSLQHIHVARVSVREQAGLVVERLKRSGTMTFRALCGDSPDTLTTVARFLSLLELFREGAVSFDQVTPLGELSVRWTGSDEEEFEIDEFEGAPPEPDAAARRGRQRHEDADRADATGRGIVTEEMLAVPVAELRPSLEALLMVADQPLDVATHGDRRRAPRRRRRRRADRAGRGVHRAGPRLRAAQRRGRLAVLHPRGVRRGRRGVRAGGPAGAADPGRAGDPGRGRLQAAGLAGPGLGDPRRERRRRDAHPADPRPGRGGGPGRVVRRPPLPHHRLLPGADRDHTPSTSCPSWRRTCPTWTTWRTSWRRSPAPRRAADGRRRERSASPPKAEA